MRGQNRHQIYAFQIPTLLSRLDLWYLRGDHAAPRDCVQRWEQVLHV